MSEAGGSNLEELSVSLNSNGEIISQEKKGRFARLRERWKALRSLLTTGARVARMRIDGDTPSKGIERVRFQLKNAQPYDATNPSPDIKK